MTSFITTMFVSPAQAEHSSPPSRLSIPSPSRPSEALLSPINSSSILALPPLPLSTPPTSSPYPYRSACSAPEPDTAYSSTWARLWRSALQSSPFSFKFISPPPLLPQHCQAPNNSVQVNIVRRHDECSNSRTRAPFKPQKAGRGTTGWQLRQFAEATLGSGSLRKAVKLPEGEDENEWLAVNGKR